MLVATGTASAETMICVDSFSHYRVLTIDNTEGLAYTDYPFPYTSIYESNMQPDFDDLRYTYENGTVISHYIKSYVASDHADVFLKISIPADSVLTFHEYFGNSDVSSISDGASVFSFFEDFENIPVGELGSWTYESSGSYNISQYSKVVVDELGHGSKVLKTFSHQQGSWCSPGYTWARQNLNLPIDTYKLEFDVYGIYNDDSYWKISVQTNNVSKYYNTGTDAVWENFSIDLPNESINSIRLGQWAHSYNAGYDVRYDNVIIRKYSASSPLIATSSTLFDPMSYDDNSNGAIDKSEIFDAIKDYFGDRLTKDEVFVVIEAYFSS